jgi:hypothetical protein
MRRATILASAILVAAAFPAQAAVIGYDCRLRDAAAEWQGPQNVRLLFDPNKHVATIADKTDPDRVWTFVSRPADNYVFKMSQDTFGDHHGTGYVEGKNGFLDAISVEAQTGRMLWIDMRLEVTPRRTVWICKAL